MLDINLFREEKGGNPEIIRESQRRRFADVAIVDDIIRLDQQWRRRQYELECLNMDFNRITDEVKRLEIAGENASDMKLNQKKNKTLIEETKDEVQKLKAEMYKRLKDVGNLIHKTVPVSNDEANNAVIRTWGNKRAEAKMKNHVQLCELLGLVNTEQGRLVAGDRGYYLMGDGVSLNEALKNFGLDFLESKGYTKVKPPSFMRQDIMDKCPQLTEFDKELYKVTGENKYLIATAEQPLCAFHSKKWIHPSELPMRYVGVSPCFRKEAGSHGKDTLGIFRTHEFEKVEQFCLTSPSDSASCKMLKEMLKISEEFYEQLGLPYQTVAIVSGALNAAAAEKYDLEAWFPASKTYRELVSCSNCTDYQSRTLETRYGQKTNNEQTKQYVHMLNCTLTALGRTMCCILENYQKEDKVEIPEVLRPYMRGKTFLPFQTKPALKARERNEV